MVRTTKLMARVLLILARSMLWIALAQKVARNNKTMGSVEEIPGLSL